MIFVTAGLSWHWELGLRIEEVRFPEVVSTMFISQLLKTSVVSFGLLLRIPFSSRVILSLVMIPIFVKKSLIAFQNDLLAFLLLLFENTFFTHNWSCCCISFYHFIGQEVFPRRLLEVFRFRSFHNLVT